MCCGRTRWADAHRARAHTVSLAALQMQMSTPTRKTSLVTSMLSDRHCALQCIQAITRLHRGDTRTDSYFARCVYYKICIPYGTQSGSPLAPSTTEHIEGHPFWRTSASSFRTVAVPMAPHSHPAANRAEERDEGQKGKKKKSKAKGRSRFGDHDAFVCARLCTLQACDQHLDAGADRF